MPDPLINPWRQRVFGLARATQGDLTMSIMPGLGAHMQVFRGDDRDCILRLADDHGILKLSLQGPSRGDFLRAPGKIVFQAGGDIFVGDVNARRVGVLVRGSYLGMERSDSIESEFTNLKPLDTQPVTQPK